MSSSTQNRIGPHISLSGTTITQALKSLPKGCDCFQCFLGAPVQFAVKKVSEEEAAQAQKMLHLNDMRMYVHAPYIINLASANPAKVTPGRDCLQKLLDTNARISPTHTGTILHIGANGTLQQVADQLNSMNISSPLFLENCAGEGSKLGASMEELHKLMELTDSHRIGLCIDTCHAHSAGLTDMRDTPSVTKLFEDLDATGRPTMFHLNDSKVPYLAKVDRHLPVGFGTIWSQKQDSLKRFAELAEQTSRDIILETPTPSLVEMAWLKTLD